MRRSTWLLVVAGLVGVNGCARTPEDIRHRFEVRIHESSSSWGDVTWKKGEPDYGRLEADVPYRGSLGTHVFNVTNFSDNAYYIMVDVDDKKKSDEKLSVWMKLSAFYKSDGTVEYDDHHHYEDAELERQLRSLCDSLKDAFRYAIH